jgi:23S rRNA (guanosine2251-2'-O)-methyltransferase
MFAEKSKKSENIVPGRKPVAELLQENPQRIDTVLVAREEGGLMGIITLCRQKRVRFRLVPRSELDRMIPGAHQGVAARIRPAECADIDALLHAMPNAPLPVLLALDQVQDPGNVGTLARTLYSLGGAGLMVPKDRSAYLGGHAAKAAAGALAHLPVHVAVNLGRALDHVAEHEIPIYGAAAHHDAHNLWKLRFRFPCALVLGGEERGLRPGIQSRCHTLVRIPMGRSVDSLNVAQAGAILLGEMWRQINEYTAGD